MERIYKGYELMWAVTKGLLSVTQRISTVNREYMNCTIEFILKEKAENIIDLDFVLIKDNINNVKELYIDDKSKLVGKGVIQCWKGRNLDIVMANKINELVRAVNQIKRKDNL